MIASKTRLSSLSIKGCIAEADFGSYGKCSCVLLFIPSKDYTFTSEVISESADIDDEQIIKIIITDGEKEIALKGKTFLENLKDGGDCVLSLWEE